ncbi:LOW QUALITY PROTEIN: protein canopy homolog 2 [Pterocles gutturalis]
MRGQDPARARPGRGSGALLPATGARRSQDLHCGACRALVDELEWEIAQVDPRKTIQMGSFRINPDEQSVVEVPYARSEAHLTELLERVCEKMKEYGEKTDPSTHRKSYVRVISHDAKMDLSGVKIDGDVASSLKFACESIAEEYEDELIEFLSHEADNVKDRLCSKRTDLCDHALHIPHVSCDAGGPGCRRGWADCPGGPMGPGRRQVLLDVPFLLVHPVPVGTGRGAGEEPDPELARPLPRPRRVLSSYLLAGAGDSGGGAAVGDAAGTFQLPAGDLPLPG